MYKISLSNNLSIRFHAELRGHFLGEDLSSLKVVSLHKGVINLINLQTGYLVSLISEKKNMTGMSMLIPGLFNKETCFPRPGESLVPSNRGEICFDNFSLSYGKTPQWTGYVTKKKSFLPDRLNEFEHLKENIEEGDSLFALLKNTCKTPYQNKIKDILQNTITEKEGKIYGLKNMLGLGQGMTPSGDDFITGVLLGADLAMKQSSIDIEGLKEKLQTTTVAGKTLLYLAIHNSYPAYLLTFIKEISEADSNVLEAVQKAAQHGSTSGLDSLTGLYWYYKYLFKN
jgi:hypothetical protein